MSAESREGQKQAERAANVGEPTRDPAVEMTRDELLQWLEFACWTALALFPILHFVHGPSVSTEQAVMRTCLVVAATLGAIALRLVNRRRASDTRSHSGT